MRNCCILIQFVTGIQLDIYEVLQLTNEIYTDRDMYKNNVDKVRETKLKINIIELYLNMPPQDGRSEEKANLGYEVMKVWSWKKLGESIS